MKIALVTGANKGIGLATARRLARECGHVIVAARNTEAGRQAADRLSREGFSVSNVTMDVTNAASVRAAAAEVSERFGHLDVLVNNAGILPEATHADPKEALDLAMFEQTYATNVFGPVAVIEAFLPLIRKSSAGRIVNVSSAMGSLAHQTDPNSPWHSMVVPAYQSSKAALNAITIVLAKALADTPIKVTSVCPGFVRTDLTPANKEQAPTTPEEAAEVIVQAAALSSDGATGTFVDVNGTVSW
ncbi:SDR family oxidoreductase [Paractinoplanes brasiliensis]|uniref:NADP-dependent 3-hydroxy acid dehydrogenase YdfG n=1 Tax=Paractinoplanes brasiliensis TaxID=52695 RepID=A0A4R6J8D7_9ACTN|nr:SDR family oxidoreductase [Actinoplanes brasiliensis]TDO31722.1 NADP-dependent 3-hydroxy acid dehydrogenase YdfG [Actinoplanes brasiliensis]GID30684.1 short-chain dehydrogenase [Actinoplanes brasiliensis]